MWSMLWEQRGGNATWLREGVKNWLLRTQSILAVLSSTWEYMTSVPLEWVMVEECFRQQGQHEQSPGGKTLWRIG